MPAPVNCSTSTGVNSLSLTGTGGASKAVVYFTFTSTSSGPQGLQWIVSTTGTSGFFLKNMRVYRSADATDLAAGNIWRSGWKQPLVNLKPSRYPVHE